MRKTSRLILVFLVVALLVTTAAGATAQAQVKDPEGVIRAIFGALNAGDVKLSDIQCRR